MNTNQVRNPSSPGAPVEGGRKRRRQGDEDGEELSPAACDQCRQRKVRCDRQQPDCSNCRKFGVSCNLSYSFKRVNHAKQLRDEFSFVFKRLDEFDRSLGALTELTRQIASRPCTYHSDGHRIQQPTPQASASPASSDQNCILPSKHSSLTSPVHKKAIVHSFPETIKLERGGELLYGSPGCLVLTRALLKLATNLLDPSAENLHMADLLQDSGVQAVWRQKLDQFPCRGPCRESLVVTDYRPITTPPRLLVNLFLDGYLHDINKRYPIFDEASLRHAIDAHYGAEESIDGVSWALILNNIVLLELRLETQLSHLDQPEAPSMNDDLIPSFIQNCDRALSNLDSFCRPRLVNIQALLTLTLVVREFYNMALGDKICQAAYQLGHALGLHRKQPSSSQENSAERDRLYSILYSVDKQYAYMAGLPCEMYHFNSDIQLFFVSKDDPSFPDAFTSMMAIWEEMYLSLYCPKALSSSLESRRKQIESIQSLISRWDQSFSLLMGPSSQDGSQEPNHMGVELQYCYHITQILLLRSDRRDENAMTRLREHAREALRLLSNSSASPPTRTSLASHGHMFRNYPIVASMDLVCHHVTVMSRTGCPDAKVDADITLLWEVLQNLKTLEHPKFPSAYYTRLQCGLSWACDILSSLTRLVLEPRPMQIQSTSGKGCSEPPAVTSSGAAKAIDQEVPVASSGCELRYVEPGLDPMPEQLSSEEGERELANFPFPDSMTGYHSSTGAANLVSLMSGNPATAYQMDSSSAEPGDPAVDFIRNTYLQGNWDSM